MRGRIGRPQRGHPRSVTGDPSDAQRQLAPPPRPGGGSGAGGDALSLLTDDAWEPGYAAATTAATTAGRRPRGSWSRRLVLPVALVLLGLLVATGAQRTATTADDRARLASALRGEVERRTAVNAETTTQVGELRGRVRAARDQRRRADQDRSATQALVAALGPVAGDVTVRGEGARIELTDLPLDQAGRAVGSRPAAQGGPRIRDHDLSDLVNVLWSAGAEAIAVNGVRLTTLSAIRAAGDLILVGFSPVTAPYRIEAIGDRNLLVRRLEESAVVDRLRHRTDSPVTSLTVVAVDHLTLPAAELQVLRHAQRSGS